MELTKRDKLILIAALSVLEWDIKHISSISRTINNSLQLQGADPVTARDMHELINKLQEAL